MFNGLIKKLCHFHILELWAACILQLLNNNSPSPSVPRMLRMGTLYLCRRVSVCHCTMAHTQFRGCKFSLRGAALWELVTSEIPWKLMQCFLRLQIARLGSVLGPQTSGVWAKNILWHLPNWWNFPYLLLCSVLVMVTEDLGSLFILPR